MLCKVLLIRSLIDEAGNDESNALSSLMETLGSLLEAYETRHIPEAEGNSIDTLKVLMEEHGSKQSDLPEIGSQGIVSEILSGKRHLNVRRIRLLSKRFGVSPAVFV